MGKISTTAIVLAAGSGKRMKSTEKKQFMELAGKSVLYYSLHVMQESNVDEIILVTAKEDMEYCKTLVSTYQITKVVHIVEGGNERFESVKNGLDVAKGKRVLIHDGARPLISKEKIEEMISLEEDNVILAVPVKDTIKIVDEEGIICATPARSSLFAAQTPQMFLTETMRKAYAEMDKLEKAKEITDDAMLVSEFLGVKVKVLEGEYTNIKITTPDDMTLALGYMRGK